MPDQELTLDDAVATIRRVLNEVDLQADPFAPEDGIPGFVVHVDQTGLVGGLIYLFPASSQLAFYVIRLEALPAEVLVHMVDLVTRINNQLVVGNFEIDRDERKLRLKVSLDFSNTLLTQALVRNVLVNGLATYSEYTVAIDAVAVDGQTALVALKMLDE